MIEVLVVDDSAFMRKVITDILNSDSEIDVIDTASNGREAIEKAELLKPDVITMDVEMPGINGIEAVEEIMGNSPVPIVMVSAHTKKGAEKTIMALEAGAVDFVEKPGGTISLDMSEVKNDLLEKVRIASQANLKIAKKKFSGKKEEGKRRGNLVVIASSTGGPKALTIIFKSFPKNLPAAIIAIQHMPATFTSTFAKRLNEHSLLQVEEGKNGMKITDRKAIIAPGGYHLEISPENRIELNKKPPLHGVRPAADITMNSIYENFNGKVIAVILSGMGKDGSIGIRNIKKRDCSSVIVQDEETSVVYGMPKSAIETGCVDSVVPLYEIPYKIQEIFSEDV